MAKKFICSDESINSYGFRVMTAGIDLRAFKKNPVLLFNHKSYGDKYNGPIGKWIDISVEDGKLLAEPVFDEDDEVGKAVSRKVEKEFIKGASIGIFIIETSTDPKHMLPGQTRPTVTKCLLYEISVVDIPSNQNALALYNDKGEVITLSESGSDLVGLNALLPITELKESAQNTNSNMNKLLMQCIALLALAPEATEDQAYSAILKLKNDHDSDKQKLSVLKSEKDTANELADKAVVEAAVLSKKITAEQTDIYLNAMKQDREGTTKKLSEMKALTLPTEILNTGIVGELKTGTGDRAEWSYIDWLKKDSAGLKKMEAENPDAFAALKAGLKTSLKGKVAGL